jgi:hypothetical protein
MRREFHNGTTQTAAAGRPGRTVRDSRCTRPRLPRRNIGLSRPRTARAVDEHFEFAIGLGNDRPDFVERQFPGEIHALDAETLRQLDTLDVRDAHLGAGVKLHVRTIWRRAVRCRNPAQSARRRHCSVGSVYHWPNREPVSSPRHIASKVRISRTTRSCTVHIKVMGPIGLERLPRSRVDTIRDTPTRVPTCRTAIRCSNASNRSLDAGTPGPDAAVSSSLPSSDAGETPTRVVAVSLPLG